MIRSFRAAVGLTLGFLCALAVAQEPSTPESPASDKQSAWFEAEWSRTLIDERATIAHGHVRIAWAGGSVRCDSAVLWGVDEEPEKKDGNVPPGEVRVRLGEIYVEGTVVATMGEKVLTLESAKGYIDLVEQRGLFFDATLKSQVQRRDGPVAFVVRAAELRQLAAGRFQALDVSLTTNPFAEPGYQILTSGVRVQIDPKAPDPEGRPGDEVTNIRYEVDSSVFQLGQLPLLATPALTGNTASPYGLTWLKRFGVSSSRKFGQAVYIGVGTDIDIDGEKWGDFVLNTQYLSDRGPGIGLDLSYRQPGYYGSLTSLYQNDMGEDELFGDPPNNDRGRVTWRHRQKLPEHVRIDLEFSKISDRGFLPEYYENEFKGGKEQETLLYLRRALENRALTLLTSTRLNDFQDQVEYQPSLAYRLFSEPVLELEDLTVYFDAKYEITRARRRYDDATGFKDEDSFRVDLDQTLAAPFFVGPIKLEPFVGFRFTHYSNDRPTEASIDRVGTLFGIRATSQLSRTWDVFGGLFDLHGLRHIITPEIEYANIDHVSHRVRDFIQFDDVDAFTEREVLRFRVRNRLQTIWHADTAPQVVDLIDLKLEWTWFFQPDRDNFGEHAGNIEAELFSKPRPDLTVLVDLEYSFVLDTFEVLNATVGWAPSETLQLALGYRRYVDTNDVVFIEAQYRVNERLALVLSSGFDFEGSQFQDQRLIVQRIGVDWVFEIEINYDNSNDFGASVSVRPRALFDPRLRSRSLRHEPRFADFADDLVR